MIPFGIILGAAFAVNKAPSASGWIDGVVGEMTLVVEGEMLIKKGNYLLESQYAPLPERTVGIVMSMILRSSHKDQFSM